MDKSRVRPEQIRTAQDLYRLPIVTKLCYDRVILTTRFAQPARGRTNRPLRYPALFPEARLIIPRLQQALNLNGRWAKLSEFLQLDSRDQFVLLNGLDVLPGQLQNIGLSNTWKFPFREQVLAEAKTLYPKNLIRQAMYSDQHTFLCTLLDRNDRMTMGASIE